MSSLPILFMWVGDCFKPLGSRAAKECDANFVIGQRYRLAEVHDRSQASHSHYFACIADAWGNLPAHWAERLPSPEHLRKYALIKAGYCNTQTFVCDTRNDAKRLKEALSPLDEFSIVTADNRTVTRYAAKSQSFKAMGKAEFQESKDKVLAIIAEMIGADPAELGRAA